MKKTLLKPVYLMFFSLVLASGSTFAASEAGDMKKKMDDSMSEEMKSMDGDMKEMQESTMDAKTKMKEKMDGKMSEGMEKMEGEMKEKPEMDTMKKS